MRDNPPWKIYSTAERSSASWNLERDQKASYDVQTNINDGSAQQLIPLLDFDKWFSDFNRTLQGGENGDFLPIIRGGWGYYICPNLRKFSEICKYNYPKRSNKPPWGLFNFWDFGPHFSKFKFSFEYEKYFYIIVCK